MMSDHFAKPLPQTHRLNKPVSLLCPVWINKAYPGIALMPHGAKLPNAVSSFMIVIEFYPGIAFSLCRFLHIKRFPHFISVSPGCYKQKQIIPCPVKYHKAKFALKLKPAGGGLRLQECSCFQYLFLCNFRIGRVKIVPFKTGAGQVK